MYLTNDIAIAIVTRIDWISFSIENVADGFTLIVNHRVYWIAVCIEDLSNNVSFTIHLWVDRVPIPVKYFGRFPLWTDRVPIFVED